MENTLSRNRILKKAINNLGYNNINEFATQHLKLLLISKIEEYKSSVKYYESKYKMDFKTFEKSFLNIEDFEDFSKEDDGMDWRFSIECLNMYSNDLEDIENAKSN